jgi:hypothetical protein
VNGAAAAGLALAVAAAVAAGGCSRGASEAAAAKDSGKAAAQRAPGPAGEASELAAVAPAGVCATKGAVKADGDGVRITDAVVRAVAPGTTGDAAALRFTYRGFSEDTVALGSGQVRRQVGLKLRAADGCNLVYVMWRIEPGPGVEVSVKANPGARTHAECGTGGYTKLKSGVKATAPRLEPNVEHTLQAEIRGDELTAWIDGAVVWHGVLPDAARDLRGPAGLRTDNVVIDAVLMASPAEGAGGAVSAAGCPAGLAGD